MQQRSVLLLGIVKTHSQHGYQIYEFIENNLACLVETKKATAYATLDRLHKNGYVDAETEQVGNRPPRKVYSITPKGEAAFLQMLRRELADPVTPNSGSDVGLMFIDHLPATEALYLLEKRLARLDEHIQSAESTPKHTVAVGVDLALDRSITLMQADRAWLARLIDKLACGEPLSEPPIPPDRGTTKNEK